MLRALCFIDKISMFYWKHFNKNQTSVFGSRWPEASAATFVQARHNMADTGNGVAHAWRESRIIQMRICMQRNIEVTRLDGK